MSDFYIEKLIISGNGKKTSVVPFEKGLNIVCGPSDTGKSYILEILDYLFGSDRIPIDNKHGYDTFEMVIKTQNGEVRVKRSTKDGAVTKTATVVSSDSRVESGEYKTSSGKKNLNDDLWLRLMGIDERYTVISNQKCDRQRLTIRSLLHSILIKEEQIIQRESVLLPKYKPSAYIASLYFMITGQDFKDLSPRVQQALKEARKQAVIGYLNERLDYVSQQLKALNEQKDVLTPAEIEEKAKQYIEEIAQTNEAISEAGKRNQELVSKIIDLDNKIKESELLLDRYAKLKTQYASDIHRLGFIVDGDLKIKAVPRKQFCPLCHSEVEGKEEPDIKEAATAEFESLKRRLNDLIVSENDLRAEKEELDRSLQSLIEQHDAVEALLEQELQPRISMLTKAYQSFQRSIELQKEREMLEQEEKKLKVELFNKEQEDTSSDSAFDIKSKFNPDIMSVIDDDLNQILKDCHFDSFGKARFDVRSDFDIIVDGKKKRSYGKGYRAFMNTIVAFEIMKYLSEHGKFNPGLLAIDSPILSLKEANEAEKASDSMKAGLFAYLASHQGYGQVILLENDIPDIDYTNVNVIRFTKDPENGRAGLLLEP